MRLPVMAAVMMTFSMQGPFPVAKPEIPVPDDSSPIAVYPSTFFSVSPIASSKIWTIRSIWASVMM